MTPETERINAALQVVKTGTGHPQFETAWEYLTISRHPAICQALQTTMETVFGPIPPPTGYSDSGEAYWSTDTLSGYLGIPKREINARAWELRAKWGERAGIRPAGTVNTVH